MSERYYADVVAVEEVSDPAEVSKFVQAGWELLKIAEVSQTKFDGIPIEVRDVLYIVGLRKGVQPHPTLPRNDRVEEDRELEERLEALPWKEAQSKRCDFCKNAPTDLVAAVRSSKDGIKGPNHHFVAHAVDPTLFRFKRETKA